VERKSKDDLIFDEQKVKNNAIDYRLLFDSSNLGEGCDGASKVDTAPMSRRLIVMVQSSSLLYRVGETKLRGNFPAVPTICWSLPVVCSRSSHRHFL